MNSVMRETREDAAGSSRSMRLTEYAVALVLGFGGVLAGCSDSGPAQEAGEAVDETVDEVEEVGGDLRGWVEDLRDDDMPDGGSDPRRDDEESSEENWVRDRG